MSYLYLLGFTDRQGRSAKYRHAAYYLGSTKDINHRFQEHQSGQGSPLVRAAIASGLNIKIVALMQYPDEPSARQAEARFKRWKNNRKVLFTLNRDSLKV
jgi:predicted GIY-YIG superfamily endonuclease